ncbi:hemerythrin domain-containing protein [Rhodococcus sp. D2-41]|uniref:hemerythrin domain-containing protein n=1 Tax=Speluncibacter jeojiensis TaxID=2710754 RepID=UPI00241058AA|nr:hemerythrin domain-containing protein [Rhodococcus sp. D2-41]MDG3010797.1 hemerythrin domain-containing protein [Rhodococcus sp. D2-41]
MSEVHASSSGDVIDFLIDQHQQIKSLFRETLAHTGDEREEQFVHLRRLLAVHETAEEEIIHPRAKDELPDGESIVQARLDEENEAKQVLGKLETLDVDSAEFERQLSELRVAVLDHADSEEREEFAQLRRGMSERELERMVRTVRLSESVAPTRPHPGVETRGVNLVAGPFASMMDRARDAIVGKG